MPGRLAGYPGVWVDADGPRAPQDLCHRRARHPGAVDARAGPQRGPRHGVVRPHRAVRHRRGQGGDVTGGRRGGRRRCTHVVDILVRHAVRRWAPDGLYERQDVAWPSSSPTDTEPYASSGLSRSGTDELADRVPGERLRIRLRQAGVDPDAGLASHTRKPPWLRVPARMGDEFLGLRRTVRDLGLVTVCEEAGCPNIFECWADGTATFMINGERCTRACGFCLVDTRHPEPPDADEPDRVAAAVEQLDLAYAVVTAVARDDLPDGGARGTRRPSAPSGDRCPSTAVEVLIPDCKGDAASLETIFAARPDVLNHNLETVARLQRAVRPSAGYARSLAVLARAKEAGLVTKSGMILGMGERAEEVVGALADLRACGVDIVTLGQYLRPTAAHLPVARWWTPEEFEALRAVGEDMGFAHVESSPLTRSSYHARTAAAAAAAAASSATDGRHVTDHDTARQDRLARVRARMGELGVDALLLSHGADLPWLTGYRAMPLERLTLLVLPRERRGRARRPRPRGAPGARHRRHDHGAPVGGDRGPRGPRRCSAGAGRGTPPTASPTGPGRIRCWRCRRACPRPAGSRPRRSPPRCGR